MNKLYFITSNKEKLKEAKEFIPEIEIFDINLIEIQSFDPYEIIEHKLKEAQKHHKGKFLVEDTSLYLEGMNGLPGPLIKFFLKSIELDGIIKLTKEFGNKAIAKCIIGYNNGEEIKYFEGIIKGKIVVSKGENGFGWDKIFMPEGHFKTFAEMSLEEKNKISHRREAFGKLKEYLDYK